MTIINVKEAKQALVALGGELTADGVLLNITNQVALKLVDALHLPKALKNGGLPRILGFININTDLASVGTNNTFVFTDGNIEQVLQAAKHA